MQQKKKFGKKGEQINNFMGSKKCKDKSNDYYEELLQEDKAKYKKKTDLL